jgi:arylsulfatase A-like enzyme
MSTRPNVIVIITDDQGYGDLSCMGSDTVRTPNIDRVAAQGVRFTSWYCNSPVCSPSRASLLTGRYPGNAGVRSILAGHRTATGLPAHVPSMARVLRDQGYATYLAGKWHLGLAEGSRPQDHGFERSFGFMAGCVDFFSHIFYWGMNVPGPGVNPIHDLWEDGTEVWRCGDYLTDVVSAKAIDYVRDAQAQAKPFFLYLAYNAPHYPMHAPKRYLDRFAHLPWDRQVMAAMIAAVDDGVGALDAELERLGLREDTIIVFMSDNGPSRESRNWLDGRLDPYYGGSAGLLKGHKFSLFEGGVRVPGIMRWPASVPGGRVSDEPVAAMDVLPTLCAALGIEQAGLDGRDLGPLLRQDGTLEERTLFWEMNGQTAARRGRWKVVLDGQLVEHEGPVAGVWLSDLESDPGERVNLRACEPAIADELAASAVAWRAGIERRWADEFAPARQGTTGHTA